MYLNTHALAFIMSRILWLLSQRCLLSSSSSALWYSVIGNGSDPAISLSDSASSSYPVGARSSFFILPVMLMLDSMAADSAASHSSFLTLAFFTETWIMPLLSLIVMNSIPPPDRFRCIQPRSCMLFPMFSSAALIFAVFVILSLTVLNLCRIG